MLATNYQVEPRPISLSSLAETFSLPYNFFSLSLLGHSGPLSSRGITLETDKVNRKYTKAKPA